MASRDHALTAGSALDTHFKEAAPVWREAMNGLHIFARATNCPLGSDVIQWFASETVRFHEAIIAEREVDRIMALTDAEVIAEAVARGDDPEAIAAEMRARIKAALSSAKPASNAVPGMNPK
jgi:hypothetical protein